MIARPNARALLAAAGGALCLLACAAAPGRPDSPVDVSMKTMNPTPVHTDAAPAAIGPYSQAIVCGDLLFCSGQIALDPATGELVGATAKEQAEQVMDNLRAVLEAGGSRLDRVVKTTIFLADMADFAAVNEVYAAALGDHRPARATVAVRTLPKDARVEIDCIATR